MANSNSNSNSKVTALKAIFISLGCLMVATLLYTLLTDGSPFRKDVLTPWLTTTLVDFYINVVVLAAWITYKESSWLATIFWIILLVCSGSITTCVYITIQLFMLSAEESSQDPMHHLLLRHHNKHNAVKRSTSRLNIARVFFGALSCLMFGVLVYTLLNYGTPFHKELLTPWMAATLIDFYINVTALSVWIGYKESSWLSAFVWIILVIGFGSIATCAYVTWQFIQLSPSDPLESVLLNNRHRAESKYERAFG